MFGQSFLKLSYIVRPCSMQSSQVVVTSSSWAWQELFLMLSGDVECNPGPVSKHCGVGAG